MKHHTNTILRSGSHAVTGLLIACLGYTSGCTSETGTQAKNSQNRAKNDTNPMPATAAEDLVTRPSDPASLDARSPSVGGASERSDAVPIGAPENYSSAAQTAPTVPALINAGAIPTPGAGIDSESFEPRKLRADLSPGELIEFLAGADRDMQQVYSGAAGIRDNDVAISKMRQIGMLKLQASKRLRDHSAASDEQRVEGSRGVLQSLSHLAALGDLQSAEELEELANENLKADDPRIVTDSRLVLIGFAIESLQHGKQDAPDRIVELVSGLTGSSSDSGVPAMMVLGQARKMLSDYGHQAQAGAVRRAIIERFAGSDNEEIAKLAAQLAGSVQFDAVEQILDIAIAGGDVSVDRWSEAARTLIQESADIMTVQYLAGASLEFEATGRDDLAVATYDLLKARFGDQSDAIGEEASIAIEAHQARQSIIGTSFDFDLPGIDGGKLDLSVFRGKVVLMPFWATGFPQSLQIMPQLLAIRDEYPTQVAIVGMNLDPAGVATAEFMERHRLDFPSFQSVSSPTANPIATRFGMVSMPFVAILDQKGTVVGLDFKGQKIEGLVRPLLTEETP